MQIYKGFTMIELLVIMAILAILSTIGLSSFQTARLKAQDAKRKSDLQTIAKSLEAYTNDHNAYPSSAAGGTISCTSPATCAWGGPLKDANGTIYAAKLPQDDLSPTQVYIYVSTVGTNYTLYAHLQNNNDPSISIFNPVVSCGTPDCNYKITSTNLP